jgi:hypothetical protein
MKKRISILLLQLLLTSMVFLLSSGYGLAYPVLYSADNTPQNSTPAWTQVIPDSYGDGSPDYVVLDESITSGVLHTLIMPEPTWHAGPDFCNGCHNLYQSNPYLLDLESNYFPLSYQINDNNLSNNSGTTVEARIKNINAQGLAISLSDGTYYETLVLSTYGLELLNTHMNSLEAGLPLIAGYKVDTTDDFHIYRMTMQGNEINVYVDCELVLTGNMPLPTSEKSVKFGHVAHAHDYDVATSMYINFESEWDYVKYAPGVNSFDSACGGNTPPVADAGGNVRISSFETASTLIQGSVTDVDPGDQLECRWVSEGTVLLDWASAGINGECYLDLSTLLIEDGTYTLSLEVSDGSSTSSDSMILTVDNSHPNAAPDGGGVYEIFADVVLGGYVSDFDGDLLDYEWSEGTSLLCSGTIQTAAGGAPAALPDCIVSTLALGEHTITLTVNDGINGPVSSSVAVAIVDTTVPTISPVINKTILWPPNHIMVDIIIEANAADNSGLPVTLGVLVESSEPVDGLGKKDRAPDWSVPVIDQDTGIINLQLRSERSKKGEGRIYTITILATDTAGNESTAFINVLVPHDLSDDNDNGDDDDDNGNDNGSGHDDDDDGHGHDDEHNGNGNGSGHDDDDDDNGNGNGS